MPPLTRRAIFAQAWPIMIGQASVPLVALVDTAVIGRTGDAIALAGVALGSIVITFLFWTFGFLRMGMTGLTAQAAGADDKGEVDAMLLRGVAAGFALGAALLALQAVLTPLALTLFAGGGALDEAARGYITARFMGAPAALAVFALTGWLFGIGATRRALALQVVMNLTNAALDILFVWHFDMGARGVGLGTAIAEWIALGTGIALAWGLLAPGIAERLRAPARLFAREAMGRLFSVNFDIMVRTIALLMLFAWFTNAGARLGPVQLGANLVLEQFILVAAYVLDAFAFTAESRIGMAIGRGSRAELLRAARLTGEFSLAAGIAFALAILIIGDSVIDLLANNDAVREAAYPYVWLVALIPLLGMPAWLLDGIFIGATRGAALRNAAILATACYIATDLLLRPWEATGLWAAMLASYVFRAAFLGLYLPGLLRSVPDRLAEAPRAL
jgi:MATE family multidrug resistance protein